MCKDWQTFKNIEGFIIVCQGSSLPKALCQMCNFSHLSNQEFALLNYIIGYISRCYCEHLTHFGKAKCNIDTKTKSGVVWGQPDCRVHAPYNGTERSVFTGERSTSGPNVSAHLGGREPGSTMPLNHCSLKCFKKEQRIRCGIQLIPRGDLQIVLVKEELDV